MWSLTHLLLYAGMEWLQKAHEKQQAAAAAAAAPGIASAVAAAAVASGVASTVDVSAAASGVASTVDVAADVPGIIGGVGTERVPSRARRWSRPAPAPALAIALDEVPALAAANPRWADLEDDVLGGLLDAIRGLNMGVPLFGYCELFIENFEESTAQSVPKLALPSLHRQLSPDVYKHVDMHWLLIIV